MTDFYSMTDQELNEWIAIAEAYAVMMESMTKTDSSITVDDTGKDGEG